MISSERSNLSDFRYDLLCVDEGHKTKSINTGFRDAICSLRVKGNRIILTGTPLQNNLNELWAVFDFVQPKIFGSHHKFCREYSEKIEKGLLKNATAKEKQIGNQLSNELREIYHPHFLRRTKDKIFVVRSAEVCERELKATELPLKTDLVVWLPLTKTQYSIYQYILENQSL